VPAGERGGPVPWPGNAGFFVRHAAHDRRPLGELTGLQVATRCSARCGAGQIVTPVTRQARSRAAECGVKDMFAAARPPRQSLACGSLGGTSAAEAPLLVIVRSAALQPLRQASWHISRDALPTLEGQRVRQSSHRAPPTTPVESRGGLVGGSSSGGPGNRRTASAAEGHTPPIPHPFP